MKKSSIISLNPIIVASEAWKFSYFPNITEYKSSIAKDKTQWQVYMGSFPRVKWYLLPLMKIKVSNHETAENKGIWLEKEPALHVTSCSTH